MRCSRPVIHNFMRSNSTSSAIAERFQQILDEKLTSQTGIPSVAKSDPQLQKISKPQHGGTPSLVLSNPQLQKIYNSSHDERIQAAQHYIKSEPLLARNKHAKDISLAQPWKGTESIHDANLRMILDLKPPPKRGDRIFTPPTPFKEKILNARENSLDYKVKANQEKSEAEQFREMYKERLLGPSMLLSNSPSSAIDIVGSLASSKINASLDQATGLFNAPEMKHVRGKPLDREHLKNSRDTNYFMNQILNKQEVLPPWIETQQSIDGSIKRLKDDLEDIWFKWLVNRSHLSDRIHSSGKSSLLDIYSTTIKQLKANPSNLTQSDIGYIEERVKLLNNSIRTYNLQCPSSSIHKFKLVTQLEIEKAFDRMIEKFPSTMDDWFEKKNRKGTAKIERGGGGFLNIWGDNLSGGGAGHGRVAVQRADNELGLWKAVKDAFRMKV
ncbi:uncharacterized protein CANTADRAFT_24668 [Suhomyces tanzawaensis NRRL Y-17324]|uniref:DnaJ homologue subfamily C member 28 conserved domain-containing protein n=1 Tax=Suhomyces tanzawaensis NRRL Y-17324 TaxID=984487 RepID=A0A1E4SR68_9ASCO|nr:uncharacterized protein CANTADRAFT_24668 [Suhomyces tanzawaensis NRRL Y-17324]ODV81937.1 hypothetical protein CANTADRAFT_24668 [Suhomyces tanzawaensis NRRL Y-17324]